MSGFRSDLDARLVDEQAGTDRLLAPLVYCSDLCHALVIVPAGFVTDYASVPRLPFAYMVVGGKGKRAAVIHDWLYSGGMVGTWRLDRKQADQVFAEALEASGYGRVVVGLMYAGVRLGGGFCWKAPNQPQPAHVAARMEAA